MKNHEKHWFLPPGGSNKKTFAPRTLLFLDFLTPQNWPPLGPKGPGTLWDPKAPGPFGTQRPQDPLGPKGPGFRDPRVYIRNCIREGPISYSMISYLAGGVYPPGQNRGFRFVESSVRFTPNSGTVLTAIVTSMTPEGR